MINHMLKNTFQVLMTRYTYFIGVKKYETVICLQSSLTFYRLSRLWFRSGLFFGQKVRILTLFCLKAWLLYK